METSEIIKNIINRPKDPYRKICKYEHCPNKEFTASRLNQEYCSSDCKKKANNLKAKKKRNATKKVNYILKNNRDILEDLFNKGQKNVTLNELQELGFDYGFHTHRKKDTKLEIMVLFYYEYGLYNEKEDSLNFFTIWKQY